MVYRLACPTLLSQLFLVLHVVVQPDVSGRVVLGDRSAIGANELRKSPSAISVPETVR